MEGKSVKSPIKEPEYYLLSIQYKNDETGEETTGNLRVINNKFVFEGNAEQSAKVFFDYLIEYLDEYIEKEQLKKEKKINEN